MLKFGLERCPDCDSSVVYASRPQSRGEEMAAFLLLQLVRCHSCMSRHYRPIFLPTLEKPASTAASSKSSWQVSATKKVERSAA
jgi:hypothetical protein